MAFPASTPKAGAGQHRSELDPQQALRVQLQMYRQIAGAVPEGIWVVDPQGHTLFSNQRMAEILGVNFESMPQQSCFTCVYPEELEDAQSHFARTLAGDRRPFNFRLRRADGSPIWVSISCTPISNEVGAPVALLGLFSDISERKRVADTLRESEERLRFAQKVASIGTFDWNIETGVNTWTPELEAMYGLPQGGFDQTQMAWEKLVHPDDRAHAVQRVKESFETGTPVEEEWRVIRPDGSVRWLAGRWQVLKNDAGKPLRMMGVHIDITDRKQIEESLRQSEERFRLAIAATNDAIWDIDLKTGTVSWNDTYSTLYGRPPETSDSWQWWIDRIQPEDRERTVDGLRGAISSGASSWTCEYRFQRADGDWAYIFDRACIARDAAGAAWRVIGAMQDLTERKRAEAAMRESEERFRN